jgi:hypothetical protein
MLPIVPKTDTSAAIARSILPYNREDNRAVYLSYRACGFKTKEAMNLVGLTLERLYQWRRDPEFKQLEDNLPEIRKQLSTEYINLEFMRNYRLLLKKDCDIITKSMQKDENGDAIPLSQQENSYLNKARSHYTPQQLQVLDSLLNPEDNTDGFNFGKLIINVQRESKRTDYIESTAEEL